MGEKAMEFETALSVPECRQRGVVGGGRSLSSKTGGFYARALGGEALTFYTPEDSLSSMAMGGHARQLMDAVRSQLDR
jgi:hypothetical protein